MMKIFRFTWFLFLLSTTAASAEIAVDMNGYGVNFQRTHGEKINQNSSISIDPDAQIDGITIINTEVFIDGEKVPSNINTYTSKKTKKKYSIFRDKNGNISVTEK